MFNYIFTDAEGHTFASKSDSTLKTPFKVLFKNAKRGYWESVASAPTMDDAKSAVAYFSAKYPKGDFDIVEAMTVSANEWEIANESYMARVRANMKVGA
jgi:hypothetical protein